MQRAYPADVELPQQYSARDVHVERSDYKAAWLEAMRVEVYCHEATGT